jgi:hypothetical protein
MLVISDEHAWSFTFMLPTFRPHPVAGGLMPDFAGAKNRRHMPRNDGDFFNSNFSPNLERNMKLITTCAPSLAAFLLVLSPHSHAADEKGLPANQLIAAIQSAVASTPGNVKEVEVDSHNGQVVIEVTIVGADGREKEIKVNPTNNQVVP